MHKCNRFFIFLFFIGKIFIVKSQVGINNEIPKASLDITKGSELFSDGILIPRLTIQELINRHNAGMYNSNQHSILVYINDISGLSTTQTKEITKTGFYYYDSNEDKWLPIESATNSIWNKIGTTSPSLTNTDNSYLTAKVVIGGDTIASINGGDQNAQLTILGEDIAIRGITVGTGNGGDPSNSIIGENALSENTTGTYNVAVGAGALSQQTTAFGNVAVGAASSLSVNANGISSLGSMSSAGSDYSTAIGANSTIQEASDKATALGYYSTIEKNSDGSIALGEGAKIAENSPTSIAIGKQAIAGAENAIAIGTGAVNNTKDVAFVKSRTTTIGNSIGSSNVTLEIIGERSLGDKADGILIPVVTLAELNAKDDQYNEPQFGTIVFVNFVGSPGVAQGKTEDVNAYGFYFYDYWNAKGARWTKLNDISIRKSTVEVGAGKSYTTLQDAYNSEAKKLYNQNGAPLEFVCSGEVGGLDTDGSIPFIKIKSDGTMTASDKNLTFNSTIVYLDGKIDVKNNNIIAYSSDLTVLKGAEIIANELSVDNSSLKAFFGGNNLTFGSITCSNGFIDIEGSDTDTNLNLVGNSNVSYLMSATNSAYILLAKNINVYSNSTSAQSYGFLSSKSSTIYCNAVKLINFNGTYSTSQLSYDIYASTASNIIFEECQNIGGTSIPSTVIGGVLKSNIINYQSIINKNTSQKGIHIISSSMSIIGDRSSITLKGSGASGSIGILSSGGDVILSSISSSSPMVTLEGFSTGIQTVDGGLINAMDRIKRSTNITTPNIPTTIGTPSLTGSVIYDSDSE